MSFLKKLFSSKQNSSESNPHELDTHQSNSQKNFVKELKKASNEMTGLKQPSDRGSDDQYEYEYSMYEGAHDKIIARVVEIIKALEAEKDVDSLNDQRQHGPIDDGPRAGQAWR